MRRTICVFVGSLCLMGCGRGGPHNPISQSTAVASALVEVEKLERERASTSSTPEVTGFVLENARLTSDTASVSDPQGNVLTVSPPPKEAWVVVFTAPQQTMWLSASAIAEVDSMTGVVVGTGLWAIPLDRPTKGYGGAA
jgi:hypothetical protein